MLISVLFPTRANVDEFGVTPYNAALDTESPSVTNCNSLSISCLVVTLCAVTVLSLELNLI